MVKVIPSHVVSFVDELDEKLYPHFLTIMFFPDSPMSKVAFWNLLADGISEEEIPAGYELTEVQAEIEERIDSALENTYNKLFDVLRSTSQE